MYFLVRYMKTKGTKNKQSKFNHNIDILQTNNHTKIKNANWNMRSAKDQRWEHPLRSLCF